MVPPISAIFVVDTEHFVVVCNCGGGALVKDDSVSPSCVLDIVLC